MFATLHGLVTRTLWVLEGIGEGETEFGCHPGHLPFDQPWLLSLVCHFLALSPVLSEQAPWCGFMNTVSTHTQSQVPGCDEKDQWAMVLIIPWVFLTTSLSRELRKAEWCESRCWPPQTWCFSASYLRGKLSYISSDVWGLLCVCVCVWCWEYYIASCMLNTLSLNYTPIL